MGLLDFLTRQDRGGRARTAASLYAVAVAQARQPGFYVALAVPDTLEGRFEMIVLHVHLLCRRLGKLGPKGAALAQALFDSMFHDMDRNLRELGVGDPSLPRRIKAMLEAYYGRIKAYEAAFAQGGDALAQAIARNIYNDEAAPGAGPLAQYALAAAGRLEAATPAELMAGRAPFPTAPERDMAKAKRSAASPAPKLEFSRPADVSRMGRLEHRMEITANEAERAALAERFDLVELKELSAQLILKKRGDGAPVAGVIELTGRWHARVAQSCVVTLEPVWADLADDVRLFYGGPPKGRDAAATADPLDDEGWPEPIRGGVIDVGEAVAQLMGVALDPYPRAPGAALPPPEEAT